jgi:hypothetical protein
MQKTQRIIKIAFWLTAGSLVLFCFIFGFPVVSQIAAGKVIEIAGCRPPSFDMQAICPPGSFAEPFVPLSHWFTSVLAPLLLLKNFGGLLLGWATLCFVLFASLSVLRAKSAP